MVNAHFIDTSVLIRMIKGESSSAIEWFSTLDDAPIAASSFLKLETLRVLLRDGLDPAMANHWLDQFVYVNVDEALLAEAAVL